jgi:hypothetical protein
MRRLLVLLMVAPVLAEEGGAGGEARLERLAMARLAFDARLKLADMLREDGKAKEALAAYARAASYFESALSAAESPLDPAGPVARADPVERALKWLATHQDDTGCWDADEFMKHDPADDKCDGKGAPTSDALATGLATLAFLGAGYLDRGGAAENPYATNVRQALIFLMASQQEDGSFVAGSLHGNAIATLAMCEAFAMTRNPRYRLPAEKGIAFLLKQQTAGAGWKDPALRDASLTAWCACALKSGRSAGLDPPERALADTLTWVDSVTDKETGRVGGEAKTEAATAAALFTRTLCGQGPLAVEAIPKGAKLCAAKPPLWNAEEGTIDLDYWFWGTRALFHVGGEPWGTWTASIKAAIVDRQQAAGSRTGSWDPVGVEGGRVHATALMALDLEVYYRYAHAIGGR